MPVDSEPEDVLDVLDVRSGLDSGWASCWQPVMATHASKVKPTRRCRLRIREERFLNFMPPRYNALHALGNEPRWMNCVRTVTCLLPDCLIFDVRMQ
jgi:hypothetical protein